MLTAEDEKEYLISKIKILCETVWGDKSPKAFKAWRNNFVCNEADLTKCEEFHAIFLLSQFMYFGNKQIRYLLKSLYRDQFKYPIIENIRKNNRDTTDVSFINGLYDEELEKTRFLGVGNPSESGPHLLYFFRQENELPKDIFINTHEIFHMDASGKSVAIQDDTIKRYIFIDDFTGSGTQAKRYSKELVSQIKQLAPSATVDLLLLFANKDGVKEINDETEFDNVRVVFELDETFKCFGEKSRFKPAEDSAVDWGYAEKMCKKYGLRFVDIDENNEDLGGEPFGFKDGQLMIGFDHNTPNNSLPIFWFSGEGSWSPFFKRFSKQYR